MKELLNPKNIVVCGVSREPHKIGYIIFDNLLSSFGGKVFGVNPEAEVILGEKIYHTVHDIKAKIDLAVISVPEKIVPKVLESCGKKGIKIAIIISAGFSEVGNKGKEREEEVLNIAKKFNMRILGPNCLGVINNFTNLNATFATSKSPEKHRVGVFSQSGAMGAAMLDYANGKGFGFSYFVSLGNKSDISEVDLIESWTDDDNVSVGIGYIEDIKSGDEFIKAAKSFTAKKPLIILKGGMTKEGNKAAKLHTAAMAQDENVFKAAMEEAGVILAQNLADVFELAVAFSENPTPKGRNLVIISNAGGPSVLAADAACHEGVNLSKLSSVTTNTLVKKTNAASVENPIDLRGDATKNDFAEAIKLCQKDNNVDGILVIVTPQTMTEVEEIAWQIAAAKQHSKKPIYTNFIGGEIITKAREICFENGVPTFNYPERAVRAFRFQSDFKNIKTREAREMAKHVKHKEVRSVINFSSVKMNYERISKILEMYGIPMADTFLCKSETDVKKSLNNIKLPVVMKISSPDILHKTDIGGVMLGIKSEREAIAAYNKIISNVKKNMPHASINGIIVMEMANEGLEVILGAKRDPIFGPVLMFGFGGIFVELISDFSLKIAPFDRQKVKELIKNTKASKIISGYRKTSNYNQKRLEDVVLAVGRLISEHKEIQSIEINPLVLEEERGGMLGLDAKIEINKDVVK